MNHRRDILRGCLRCGGLFALGGLASTLGWRAVRGPCLRTDPCGACPLFSGCGLPKALDTRNVESAAPPTNSQATRSAASHV